MSDPWEADFGDTTPTAEPGPWEAFQTESKGEPGPWNEVEEAKPWEQIQTDGRTDGMQVARREEPLQTGLGVLVAPIGKALRTAGRLVAGGLADLGSDITGQSIRERYDAEAGRTERQPSNIEQVLEGELPAYREQRKILPTPLRVAASGASGLAESVPQLAGVTALQAAGVPAPVAAGAVFGTTPEGFDKKQAAVAAALPFVGKYSGAITGAIARRLGVSQLQAINIFKGAGGVAGAAAYAGTIDESEIENLPPEERKDARIEMIAGLIGQSALGPMGVEFDGKAPRTKLQAPEKIQAPMTEDGRVSEFGGEADLPPPSGQGEVEKTQPGATGAPSGEATGAKTAILDFSAEAAAPSQVPVRILEGQLREMSAAHEDIPARLIEQWEQATGGGWGLPEGWTREGDVYKYTEPVKEETSAAREQREREEAMAGLREAKAAEAPSTNIQAPRPTERVEAGTPMEVGERPPDIIDAIEGNFSGGIRISSKADFGELLSQSRGRAKELLSLKGGERADEVVKELQAQGWRRIESEEDLIHAVNGAAEERLAWAGREKAARTAAAALEKEAAAGSPDPDWSVEGWLDAAIEATRPDGSMLMEGITGPIWMTKAAVNGALRVARAAYRVGRDVAAAIREAVEHVRGLGLKGFNEREVRDWLTNWGERETGQKILGSTVVSEDVKGAVSQYLYERRTNATDQDLADGILKEHGVDGAWQVWQQPPTGMPGAVRSMLLGSITRALRDAELQARVRGDTAGVEAIARRAGEIWDQALPQITDLAQSLQALNDLVDLSPDAQVARMRRRLERAADEQLDRRRPELTAMQGALEQGRQEGVEQIRKDPAVNGAARAAVDVGVENSGEVHRAIVMELTEEWAELSQWEPQLVNQARELVRERATELLQRGPKVGAKTAGSELRRILDDVAQRAAQIFAGHLQGAEPELSIVEKLQQRLGLTRGKAVDLATVLSQEWERQLAAARKALPKRIARERMARERAATGALPEGAPDGMVERAIRGELRRMNVRLGQVLQQESGKRESTGAHVAERIVQASGLTGEKADTLRTTLQARWDAIVTRAQVRALEQLQARSGIAVTGKLKGAFERLVALDRLGALTSERFYDVVKQALKLKRLTPEDAAKLRDLAQKAQGLPEGYLRQQAANDVLKLTERLTGNASLRDLPLAIFYANILSGFTTPAKIVLENMNLLTSSTAAALLARPKALLHPADLVRDVVRAYGAGLHKGALQAASTLKTGVVTGVWPAARTPTILEMKPFGEKLEPLNFWKWFTRGISTAHETTFKPAWELKQTLLARDVAEREGLTGAARAQRVADLMADTEGHWARAKAQALSELQTAGRLNKVDLARRTREILEQQREEKMPGSTEAARDFALRTAYLNEPYGLMGLLTKGLRSTLEQARREFPVLGTGVKTQIPFTTVVANILNEKLNWTPIGFVRTGLSHKTGKLYGREIMDPSERAELYAKAIVGTIALGMMWAIRDRIHGNGPSDPGKRKQLQAAGWVPHSIEYNGRYYSYMNTPEGVEMAVIGNVMDWHRYGKGDDADNVSRLAFAAKATLNAIISQGMLDSLKRVFEGIGSESTTEGAEKLERLAARTASSFVVPNLVQQVDRIFDPTVYDKTGMEALVRGQVPFVRRLGKPALTVLGDPVEVGPFAYWAGKLTKDPLLRILAEKQAWVPEPKKEQIVGDKKRGPDYARALTPAEFYNYVKWSGRAIRERLMENLDAIADMDPDQARAYVRRIAEQERAKVKAPFE